jgi:hypothetical protein
MSMIVIKIFFDTPRSREWYRDVLPDVPLTVFRMDDTLFQKSHQRGVSRPKIANRFKPAYAHRI